MSVRVQREDFDPGLEIARLSEDQAEVLLLAELDALPTAHV